jgi:adenine-specific DNA-methyltransferase
VVDQETRNRLVGEDPQCRQILKPFLRGRDVKRWRVQYAGLWLINTHNGYGGTPPVDVDDYPVIKAHLDEVERRRAAGELGEKAQKAKGLFRRDDQGRTPYNLRNCVYVPEFEKPKIIYPDIYEHQSFALDTGGHFSANTTYFIPNEKPWLLALLNSKLVEWFYGSVSNRVRGGYLRAFSDYIRQIPIASVPENEAEHLEQTIQFILIAKKNAPSADVSALEAEIDHLVYKLYDLTPEEIAIVEESTAGGSQARKTAPQPPAVEKTSRRKTTPDLPPSLPGWD